MSNFKVSQLPASTELVVEDILPVVDVSQMLTKKAEVGDLIDLAANTIESMPNLIVDPENNFTNFSQAVRNELTGGDGITYTAATGEVKLTNKSITINGNIVNLGGSTTIPVGTTYTAGSGINISPTNEISATPVAAGVTSINSISDFGNLTFSPPNGSVTANFSSEPIFYTIAAFSTNGNGGNSLPPKRDPIASFGTDLDKTVLTISSSQTVNNSKPAVVIDNTSVGDGLRINHTNTSNSKAAVFINNFGTGDSFVVTDDSTSDFSGDLTRFIIDSKGNVGIGVANNVADEKLRVQGKLAQSGSYSNKSNVFATVTSDGQVIPVNSTSDNHFIVSGLTGSVFVLPSLGSAGVIGTEFSFRKMQSAPVMAVRAVASDVFDLQITYPGSLQNMMFFNTTDEVFLKVRAVTHPGLGSGSFPMWSVVYLNTIKSTTYSSYFPSVSLPPPVFFIAGP